MQFIDSIKVNVYDINRCTKCGEPILPEDEIVQYESETGAIYKVDHFNCACPSPCHCGDFPYCNH